MPTVVLPNPPHLAAIPMVQLACVFWPGFPFTTSLLKGARPRAVEVADGRAERSPVTWFCCRGRGGSASESTPFRFATVAWEVLYKQAVDHLLFFFFQLPTTFSCHPLLRLRLSSLNFVALSNYRRVNGSSRKYRDARMLDVEAEEI